MKKIVRSWERDTMCKRRPDLERLEHSTHWESWWGQITSVGSLAFACRSVNDPSRGREAGSAEMLSYFGALLPKITINIMSLYGAVNLEHVYVECVESIEVGSRINQDTSLSRARRASSNSHRVIATDIRMIT